MKATTGIGLVIVLAACTAEAPGERAEGDAPVLRILLEQPDEPLRVGYYDLEEDRVVLYPSIVDAASEGSDALFMVAGTDRFALEDGEATAPSSLSAGDVVALSAGDAVRWDLTVGEAAAGEVADSQTVVDAFLDARNEQDLANASSLSCLAFPYGSTIDMASWGCGSARGLTAYEVDGTPLYTEYTYSIHDRLTDGHCVQVYLQDIDGNWFEGDGPPSCGAPHTVYGKSSRPLRRDPAVSRRPGRQLRHAVAVLNRVSRVSRRRGRPAGPPAELG